MKILIVFVILFTVYWAYRIAATLCRRSPVWRFSITIAAAIALGLVVFLVPKAGNLKPPFSESPAGIFVILARIILLSCIGLSAIGALLGAAFPGPSDQSEPAA